MYEAACEAAGTCDTDQQSFKAYLARWIAAAIVKAPFTYDSLKPILEASATAAAATCTGGTNGTSCGNKWYTGSYDGTTGVGEQMSALEVIQSNLLTVVAGPVTEDNGGTSKGDSNAGSTSDIDQSDLDKSVVTTKDRAGAALMTVLLSFVMIGGALWIMI